MVLWMNKVGPNVNPQETYPYSSLPFCQPKEKTLAIKSDTIGSLLEGNELTGMRWRRLRFYRAFLEDSLW